MRTISAFLSVLALLTVSLPSVADECWAMSNIKGYSAYADQNYRFATDGLPNRLEVCFGSDGGVVTGTDIKFLKFGASTLAGYGGNDRGNELFEVYQLDRAKMKMLYVKSRIGTKTVMPLFSDVVSSYVGDATPISK